MSAITQVTSWVGICQDGFLGPAQSRPGKVEEVGQCFTDLSHSALDGEDMDSSSGSAKAGHLYIYFIYNLK